MKRILALLALTLVLTGCDDKTQIDSFTVTTKTGRTIECVSWSGYQKGGLSCDWSPR